MYPPFNWIYCSSIPSAAVRALNCHERVNLVISLFVNLVTSLFVCPLQLWTPASTTQKNETAKIWPLKTKGDRDGRQIQGPLLPSSVCHVCACWQGSGLRLDLCIISYSYQLIVFIYKRSSSGILNEFGGLNFRLQSKSDIASFWKQSKRKEGSENKKKKRQIAATTIKITK